jgi:hypothetical protein
MDGVKREVYSIAGPKRLRHKPGRVILNSTR